MRRSLGCVSLVSLLELRRLGGNTASTFELSGVLSRPQARSRSEASPPIGSWLCAEDHGSGGRTPKHGRISARTSSRVPRTEREIPSRSPNGRSTQVHPRPESKEVPIATTRSWSVATGRRLGQGAHWARSSQAVRFGAWRSPMRPPRWDEALGCASLSAWRQSAACIAHPK